MRKILILCLAAAFLAMSCGKKEKTTNWDKPLFTISNSGDTTAVWRYNDRGLLVYARNSNGEEFYEYDSRDSVISIKKPYYTETRKYGSNGYVSEVRMGEESTTYQYDGKVIKVHNVTGSGTVYDYEYEYADDKYERIVRKTVLGEHPQETLYEYYPDGRIKKSGDTEYVYDEKNRLKSADDYYYTYNDDGSYKEMMMYDPDADYCDMYSIYDSLGREVEFFMRGTGGLFYTREFWGDRMVMKGTQNEEVYDEDNSRYTVEQTEFADTTYYAVE